MDVLIVLTGVYISVTDTSTFQLNHTKFAGTPFEIAVWAQKAIILGRPVFGVKGISLLAPFISIYHIGSLARDFHIGFDPDYEFN